MTPKHDKDNKINIDYIKFINLFEYTFPSEVKDELERVFFDMSAAFDFLSLVELQKTELN